MMIPRAHPQRYQSSGQVPGWGGALFIVGGAIISVIIGVGYQCMLELAAHFDLNPVVPFLFAMCIGGSLGLWVRVCKLRNPTLAGLWALILIGFSLYVSWMVWSFFVTDFQTVSWHVSQLFDLASDLVMTRSWQGDEYGQIYRWMWFWWLVEALVWFVFGMTGFHRKTHRLYFCEACNHWASSVSKVATFRYPDNGLFLGRNPVDKLVTLPVADALDSIVLEAEVSECGTCRNLCVLDLAKRNVNHFDLWSDYKVTGLVINREQVDRLWDRGLSQVKLPK